MTTTPAAVEALKLAEEAKRLAVDALNLAESTMPPFVGVSPGQQAMCAVLDAIDRLAALAQQPPAAVQAKRGPLTAKNIERLWAKSVCGIRVDVVGFARAIERAHNIPCPDCQGAGIPTFDYVGGACGTACPTCGSVPAAGEGAE